MAAPLEPISVCQTTVVQDAWQRTQPLTIHGWIYSLTDGLLRDLGVCVSDGEELAACCRAARVRPDRQATRRAAPDHQETG